MTDSWGRVGAGQSDGWDILGRIGRRVGEVSSGWRVPIVDPIIGATQLGLEGIANVLRYPVGVAKGLGDVAVGVPRSAEDILSPGGALERFEELPGYVKIPYDIGASFVGTGPLAVRGLLRIPAVGGRLLGVRGGTAMEPVISPLGQRIPQAVERLSRTPLAQGIKRAVDDPRTYIAAAGVGAVTTPTTTPEGAERSLPEFLGEAVARAALGATALGVLTAVGKATFAIARTGAWSAPLHIPDHLPGDLKDLLRQHNENIRLFQRGTPASVLYPGGWWGLARDNIRRALTDRFSHLQTLERRVAEVVESQGQGGLAVRERPYLLARLLSGLRGDVEEWFSKVHEYALRFREEGSRPDSSFIGKLPPDQFPPGYRAIGIKADPRDLNTFDAYVTFKTRIDRLERGLDEPDEALRQAKLADLRKKFNEFVRFYVQDLDVWGAARYEATMARLKEVHDDLLRRAMDAGLISVEGYRAMIQKPFYARVHDVDQALHAYADRAAPPGQRLFAVTSGVGREREAKEEGKIVATLQSLLERDQALISIIERNRVARAVLNAAKRDPEGIGAVVTPNADFLPTPANMQKVPVFINGQRQYFLAPDWLADTMAVVDAPQVDVITRIMGSFVGNIFRAGVTTYSTTFVMRNVWRDFFTAIQNYDRPLVFIQNYIPAVIDVLKWSVGAKGTAMAEMRGSRGAIGAFIEQYGRPKLAQEYIPGAADQPGMATKVYDAFQKMLLLTELPPRVAIYKSARSPLGEWEKALGMGRKTGGGLSKEEAALLARSMTTDFSKGGHAVRVVNLWFPLLNARLQGELQTWDSLSKDPQGFALRATATIALPYLASYAWNRLNYSDLFDKIPLEETDRNVSIIYGSYVDPRDGEEKPLYITIPMNDVALSIVAPLRQELDRRLHTEAYGMPLQGEQRLARPDPLVWKEVLANLIPTNPKAERLGPEELLISIATMQPVLGMAVQMYANEDHFYGRPIVEPGLERLPVEYRVGDRTTKTSQRISKLLKDAGIPEDAVWAPSQIDFAVRSLSGQAGTMLLAMGDIILERLGWDVPPPRSLAELGIDPQSDPVRWEKYLNTLRQPDIRPLLEKVLSPYFGSGGGQQTILAKASMLSEGDRRRWLDTLAVDNARREWLAFHYYPKRDSIANERPEQTNAKKLSEYLALRKERRQISEHLASVVYRHAITDPQKRREFVEKLPGVPVSYQYHRAVMSLPEGARARISEYSQRYWSPPGVDMTLLNPMAQQEARNNELRVMAQEIQREYGQQVHPLTLRQAIVAYSQGIEIPSLPVPAVYVDLWVDRYFAPRGLTTENVDGETYRRLQRLEVEAIAKEYNVKPEEVLEAINTRIQTPEDSTPFDLAVFRALRLSSKLEDTRRFPRYVSPDGQPLGTPAQWDEWDALIDRYVGAKRKPGIVVQLDAARRRGNVLRLMGLYSDPDYVYYQRFFGLGRNMESGTWEKYLLGELPRYRVGGPQQWQQMDALIALHRALPVGDPMRRRLTPIVKRIRKLITPGWRGIVEFDELSRRTLSLDQQIAEEEFAMAG